jgi:hypothetical protein
MSLSQWTWTFPIIWFDFSIMLVFHTQRPELNWNLVKQDFVRWMIFDFVYLQRGYQFYSRLLFLVKKCRSISHSLIRFLYNASVSYATARTQLKFGWTRFCSMDELWLIVFKEDINFIAGCWSWLILYGWWPSTFLDYSFMLAVHVLWPELDDIWVQTDLV